MTCEEFTSALLDCFRAADLRHGVGQWQERWRPLNLAIREKYEPGQLISIEFHDVPPKAYAELLAAFKLAFT